MEALDSRTAATAELMDRFNAVFLQHDPTTLPSMIAEDCVIEKINPTPNGDRCVGRDACVALTDIATAPGTRFDQMHRHGNALLISLAFECHEDRNGRPGMLWTTLAMAPIYPLRLTSRDKTDRTTEAATFGLIDRAAHDPILPFSAWSQLVSREKRQRFVPVVTDLHLRRPGIWVPGVWTYPVSVDGVGLR
jgi:hypothetical protein